MAPSTAKKTTGNKKTCKTGFAYPPVPPKGGATANGLVGRWVPLSGVREIYSKPRRVEILP